MNSLEFGEFTLDSIHRQVRRNDLVLPIAGKAFDLLQYMAANAGRPLLKDELLKAVWPDNIVEETNLTQNVSILRKALGSGPKGPIVTLPGRGYQFAAQVTEIVPARSADTSLPKPQVAFATPTFVETTRTRLVLEEQTTATRHPGWRLWAAASVVGALAAASTLGWRSWQNHTGSPPVQVVLTSPDGTTGDPVLDRTLTDALRMDLAQSPFVSVVASPVMRATMVQMMHKPDDPVTPARAREICERTNSQAVLHSTIVRVGERFLLTEDATSCVDEMDLGQVKQEASGAEDLPRSIDRLADSLRRKLGESRRSIARFNTPLIASNTASLEALRYYSLAKDKSEQGQWPDAIALLKKAVLIDPAFASAYYDLAAAYGGTEDFTSEREALQKAHSLGDSASEPVRLAINALYSAVNTQDLYESERTYRNWTELYPRSAQAWNGLSNTQRELGRYMDSASAAGRAVALRPTNQGLYANLSYMQLRSGDARGTEATCEQAIARGLDGERIRVDCFEAALALNDAALVQAQKHWEAAHPESVFFRIAEVELAISEGRFADSHRLLAQCADLFRQQGIPGAATSVRQLEGSNLIEAGDVDEGLRLFHLQPIDPEDASSVDGLALAGDFATAEAAVRAMSAKYPQGTLWNLYTAPYVHALHAMEQHKPGEAVDALETSRPLEGRDFGHPFLRAQAYLADGKPAQAEKEYRTILSEGAAEPTAIELPLSWLGLARALAAQNKPSAAIGAYQHFLALWAHADPQAAFLKQARLELAELQTKQAK